MQEDLYICGQITSKSVTDIKQAGIKTVTCLRYSDEKGFMDLSKELEAEGIAHRQYPLDWGQNWTDGVLDKLMGSIDGSEFPQLLYCEVGARAAAISCAYINTRSKFNKGSMPIEGTDSVRIQTVLSELLGSEEAKTQKLETVVREYTAKKVNNMLSRPGMKKLADDLFVAGQLTESELEDAAKEGIKAVLNMRPMSEAGEFGVGVLAREEEIVKGLGLQYVNIPVPKNGPYASELLAQVNKTMSELPRPLLVHCRSGKRATNAINQANAIPN